MATKTTEKKVVKSFVKKIDNLCKSCEKILDLDSVFCKFCGTSINVEKPTKTVKKVKSKKIKRRK